MQTRPKVKMYYLVLDLDPFWISFTYVNVKMYYLIWGLVTFVYPVSLLCSHYDILWLFKHFPATFDNRHTISQSTIHKYYIMSMYT